MPVQSAKFTDPTHQTYSTYSKNSLYRPESRLCQTRALMREPFDSSDGGRLRRLEALDELLPALSGVLDIREVFVRVSAIAQNVLPHDLLGIPLLEDDGVHARLHAITGKVVPDVPGRVRVPDPTIATRPWDHVIIDDTFEDPLERGRAPARAGYRSLLRLPLRLQGKFLGVLDFYSMTPGFYRPSDILIARRIADHVLLALSHQRLADEQRRTSELSARAANLELLDEVLAAVTGSGELPDVWDRVAAVVKKVLDHDALLLSALLPDGKRGRVYASKAPEAAAFAEYVHVPPAVLNNPAWEYDLVTDLQTQDDQRQLESTKLGYRAALRVPLRLDGEFVAALSFLSLTAGRYTLADLPVAQRVASRMLQSFARERRTALKKQADEASERIARLESRVRELSDELDTRTGYRRVVGESPSWRQVLVQATQVAATETTALLLGESGTGKEVVARFLHRASARKNGPYVALNCAALPEQLLEAELFGYERGAFTGAHASKPGQLEQASGGTLFLDEVGEMSLPAQAKFLRVLQEKEFQRLGGTRVLRTDARVVAATNRDLPKAIRQGLFREDLFYRLNVFHIQLPPLRHRKDDILLLSEAFLNEIGRTLGRPPGGISRDARQRLIEYAWPGNVRELRNILERAAILCDGGLITTEHLSLTVPTSVAPLDVEKFVSPVAAATHTASNVPSALSAPDLASVEKAMIEQALRDARFNKSKAAKQLGLTRTQLYGRMRRHGLE